MMKDIDGFYSDLNSYYYQVVKEQWHPWMIGAKQLTLNDMITIGPRKVKAYFVDYGDMVTLTYK